ncbi:MAG: NPCBM/NEW2 domain-containing protein [Kiritimatiellaeota bacterium]|nr:NPCBM/NEW2 domain-containing protein [Kiritimatiellota bacterium]
MKKSFAHILGGACAVCALAVPEGARAQDAGRPVLRVAYFTPTDRTPEPDRVERLDRVLREVQRFYKEGMAQNGYPGRGFELDRDANGALRIFDVNGKHPMREYGRNDSGKVRGEVKDALARQGVNIDREVIVIFQQLLEWQDGKATELGPYVGSGGARYGCGTAWVYDDAKLDARLLASKEPGGYYHGHCSLGKFNTHYIGGTAHELGHAFGLPHDCESAADRAAKGASLMGGGNHTYGMDVRGEGLGTFLSAASALPLSVHPLFTGKREQVPPVDCRITALAAGYKDGHLTLDGRLEGPAMPVGIVALNNFSDTPGDYHAVGWTSPVAPDGRFRLAMNELQPGNYGLRLRAYGPAGDEKTFTFSYKVDAQGVPDRSPFEDAIWLQNALEAFNAKDAGRLKGITAEVRRARKADPTQLLARLAHMDKLLTDPKPAALASVTANTALLGDIAFESATVGWGQPLRNQVLANDRGPLIEVGSAFFPTGLYAHAPSGYVYAPDGKWKTLATGYGIQDGNSGTVVFVIKGDGKELFRSDTIRDHTVRTQTVSVQGIRRLELITEDAGDGNGSDWGVWLEPRLQR